MNETPMTRAEREDLVKLCRKREKLAQAAAVARGAELMAEFEKQISAQYSYDSDDVWKAATEAANTAVQQAIRLIPDRCRELGIHAEVAPRATVAWSRSGA